MDPERLKVGIWKLFFLYSNDDFFRVGLTKFVESGGKDGADESPEQELGDNAKDEL